MKSPAEEAEYIINKHLKLWGPTVAKNKALEEADHWKSQCLSKHMQDFWEEVKEIIKKSSAATEGQIP